MALKLFHLMVLRGIDSGREGTQKSIKSEKGEIKSSPSHHLLKWVYSLFSVTNVFSHHSLDKPVRSLFIPSISPAFIFISVPPFTFSSLILAPWVFLSLPLCPSISSLLFLFHFSSFFFLICIQIFLIVFLNLK